MKQLYGRDVEPADVRFYLGKHPVQILGKTGRRYTVKALTPIEGKDGTFTVDMTRLYTPVRTEENTAYIARLLQAEEEKP